MREGEGREGVGPGRGVASRGGLEGTAGGEVGNTWLAANSPHPPQSIADDATCLGHGAS